MKLAKWSDVGAITSAGTVAATIFCCLPFATGLIGASVAAFGSRIAPFQPYLIGLSVASLAYSFYEASDPIRRALASRANGPPRGAVAV